MVLHLRWPCLFPESSFCCRSKRQCQLMWRCMDSVFRIFGPVTLDLPWFWSYFKYILICLHTSMLHTMESEAKEVQVSFPSKHTWAAIAGAIDWGRSTLDSGFWQGIKMNQSIGILHWWLWCAFGDWWQWLLTEIGEHGTWWWFCKENAASHLLMGDYDMKLCDKWLASRNTMKYGTRHT